MSFRELRNFTEILRALGYPRLVSMENFRVPNFELVADCLVWLIQRYDPKIDIVDDISTEADRVAFLKAVTQTMATRGRLKLNAKRLYSADGYAVKELLKIADLLYLATQKTDAGEDGEEADVVATTSSTVFDVKMTRSLASEITSKGAALYDALETEGELREARKTALNAALDTSEVEAFVREAIVSVQENTQGVDRMMGNLQKDKKSLDDKIDKRRAELERCEKRLATLQSVHRLTWTSTRRCRRSCRNSTRCISSASATFATWRRSWTRMIARSASAWRSRTGRSRRCRSACARRR